ncbi:unnamed protein product [Clonostachys chloroleuca]|uniref:Uncharacterized protein n=1 Tax=Clonostachys chloroleuca TaxID=1926264 RepID=A0AA35MB44_9HYPO|nr:unnamed protein product [Clonostachys chloroleuca]
MESSIGSFSTATTSLRGLRPLVLRSVSTLEKDTLMRKLSDAFLDQNKPSSFSTSATHLRDAMRPQQLEQ